MPEFRLGVVVNVFDDKGYLFIRTIEGDPREGDIFAHYRFFCRFVEEEGFVPAATQVKRVKPTPRRGDLVMYQVDLPDGSGQKTLAWGYESNWKSALQKMSVNPALRVPSTIAQAESWGWYFVGPSSVMDRTTERYFVEMVGYRVGRFDFSPENRAFSFTEEYVWMLPVWEVPQTAKDMGAMGATEEDFPGFLVQLGFQMLSRGANSSRLVRPKGWTRHREVFSSADDTVITCFVDPVGQEWVNIYTDRDGQNPRAFIREYTQSPFHACSVRCSVYNPWQMSGAEAHG